MKFWPSSHFITTNIHTRLGSLWNGPSSARGWVEKALDQQEIALDIFLDIEGASDNPSYGALLQIANKAQ